MKRTISSIAIFTSLILVACGGDAGSDASGKDANSSFDLAAAKTEIEAANDEFEALMAKSDSAGLANLYTTDAKVMGGNMAIVSGKANIQSTFNGLLSMGIAGIKLTTIEVWGTESLVSEEGTYGLSDKSGNEIDKGKYIVLWKKEDGKWKLFRDCFNSDIPCPTPSK